jgi:hypothetical protein
MNSVMSTMRLEKELISRGILPDHCRLIEVRIEPKSALVVRYEVFVTADQLESFADAMKAAASQQLADDERYRKALQAQGEEAG